MAEHGEKEVEGGGRMGEGRDYRSPCDSIWTRDGVEELECRRVKIGLGVKGDKVVEEGDVLGCRASACFNGFCMCTARVNIRFE